MIHCVVATSKAWWKFRWTRVWKWQWRLCFMSYKIVYVPWVPKHIAKYSNLCVCVWGGGGGGGGRERMGGGLNSRKSHSSTMFTENVCTLFFNEIKFQNKNKCNIAKCIFQLQNYQRHYYVKTTSKRSSDVIMTISLHHVSAGVAFVGATANTLCITLWQNRSGYYTQINGMRGCNFF